MKRIILASASPRRRELLEQIGIEFEIKVSDKEEIYQSTEPEAIVKELALMKVENVSSELDAEECKHTIVIGADTIVVLEGNILGKPKDEEDAFQMISCLQGRSHQVYTGVALVVYDEVGNIHTKSRAVETKVYVNPMEDFEIREYVDSKEPMDKAGGYGIQGRFAAYIDRIEGDYYNVVGLPISYVYQELKRSGDLVR